MYEMEEEIFIIRYRGSAEDRDAIHKYLMGKLASYDHYNTLLKNIDIRRATTMQDIFGHLKPTQSLSASTSQKTPSKQQNSSGNFKEVKKEPSSPQITLMTEVMKLSAPLPSLGTKTICANIHSLKAAKGLINNKHNIPSSSRQVMNPTVHRNNAPSTSLQPKLKINRVPKDEPGEHQNSESYSDTLSSQKAKYGRFPQISVERKRKLELASAYHRRYPLSSDTQRRSSGYQISNFQDFLDGKEKTISSQTLKLYNINLKQRS